MTADIPSSALLGHVVGLDLGQSADPSAVAVLEAREVWDPAANRWQNHYGVRYLKRWPLGTPYPAIVAEVAALVATKPLDDPLLAVDQTGVGAAVLDFFREANLQARLRPILITGGHTVRKDEAGVWHVPKKELVSVLQVLLQSRRIKVAPMPERELLLKELLNFRVKITAAANETFSAWREGDHDDLVLAVALAAWLGENSSIAAPVGMPLSLGVKSWF